MPDSTGGTGWQKVGPGRYPPGGWASIDALLPEADWFWSSLERNCVPGCCGLDAYDLSAESVAWACGWGTERPAGNDWRDENPGDPRELAAALRDAARQVRAIEVTGVSAALFNDALSPESCAQLLEHLADSAEPRVFPAPTGPS